jgi:hypothetical protein
MIEALLSDIMPGVHEVETPEALSALHQPGCAAAIWQRHPLTGFQAWLNALSPDQLPRARVILRPQDVRAAVTQICQTNGTPEGPERARLIDDIAALADIFSGLTRARFLRLRLDVVTTNACRKFHVDAITARLVCTYRGTGTQYGHREGTADPTRIHTLTTGAPILMRGTLWPEQPASGFVHRSPPIEGTGETRLVLVLDPIDDPDDAI